MKEEPLKEETLREETLKKEIFQDERLREETSKEGTLKEETLRQESSKQETSREGTLKEEALGEETLREKLKEELKEGKLIEEELRETVKLQFETIQLFHKNFAKTLHQIRNSQCSLNKNQNRAILVIGAAENIMPTTLGKCLDLQKGSLTSMIDSLEKYELVCRRKHLGDRRKTLLVLTEKGEKYREWLKGELEKNASEVLKKMGEKDLAAYKKSLQTMYNVLKKLDEASRN